MKKVAILISYLRENLIENVMELAEKNAGIPTDDFYIKAFHNKTIRPLAEVINMLVEETESEMIMFLGDDTLPQKDYLKNALDAMCKLPDQWGAVMVNDGKGVDRPSHLLIDRRMINLLGGKIVHEGYWHCCSDIELIERSKAAGRYIYCKESLVLHNHPMLVEGVETDKYYQMFYEPKKREEDQALLSSRRKRGWPADDIKIAIALPSRGNIKTITTVALMNLYIRMHLDNYNPQIIFTFGRVETGRNQAVEKAQKKNCSHILFIDSDMDFPADSCSLLLKANKEIIGCNAAKKKTGNPVIEKDIFSNPIDYIKGGLIHVDFIGMAVTLIKMDVFNRVDKPWFYAKPEPGCAKVNSEDVTFCKNAWHGHQIKTFCHLDLSIQIGHIDGRERVVTLENIVREQIETHDVR